MLVSDTALPLAQLGEQLGLDLYRLSGLNQGTIVLPHCDCYTALQRADLTFSLQLAEALFLRETRAFPAPQAVDVAVEYKGARVKPPHFQLRQFGIWEWTDLDEQAVDKGAPGPDETFTVTVAGVPAGTTADEIHVYVTAADGGTPMQRAWEIRPLTVEIAGGNATITGPAYLFGRNGDCLSASDVDNYLDDVHVYRRSVDVCQQGSLAFRGECGVTSTALRFDPSPPNWYEAVYAACQDDALVMQHPELDCWPPLQMHLTYIAGFPISSGMVDDFYARILMMLTIANMDGDFKFCDCDDQARYAWKHWRQVPKEAIGVRLSGPGSAQYSLLFDRDTLRKLDGLDPNRGNLTGIQQLRKMSIRVSGGLV